MTQFGRVPVGAADAGSPRTGSGGVPRAPGAAGQAICDIKG